VIKKILGIFNLIAQKIEFELRKIKEKFLININFYDEKLVVFEGGLGSQILAFYEVQSLLSKGIKPNINLEYFMAQKINSHFILDQHAEMKAVAVGGGEILGIR
jgi:hypothetical protein